MNNDINMTGNSSILVVDDTRENLRLLSDLLTGQGYDVRPVSNGRGAISSARFRVPDLALLDILMPGVDGYAVCQALKADERTRDVPIIFISALGDTLDKVKAFNLGGVDYITKPFQAAEVLARVRAHLTIQKIQQQLQEQNVLLQQQNARLEEQKRELEESEARFRGLSEATFEGIVMHDEGRILDGNRMLEDIFGYQRAEILGKNALEFLAPECRDIMLERIRTKDETPYEAEGFRKDGSRFPLEIQGKTMPYQGRDVRVAAVRDLTRRKAMEEENAKMQEEQLTFSMETLGFVTHELKAPLSAMQSMIAMMLEGFAGEVPDKVSTYLLRIRRNCEELQDMVKNYLDLSRVGMGELVARKAPVNYYKEVVAPCVDHTQIFFESREVTLTVDCPDNLTVQADADLLRIALTNYLSNAAKYGAAHTQTRLIVREEHDTISTAVWNEGTGFRPEEQAALFSKFSRLQNQNTANKRGSGLGLYLTKHIIELHGGKVWAESEPEQWAKFCFSVPSHAEDMLQDG
jgi:PAS domain S-box-containing protein